MEMTPAEVFDYARQAVENMLKKTGKDARFPFDQIWNFLPPGIDIPPTRRSSQAKNLEKAGFLKMTGNMVNASRAAGKGRRGPEYTFGEKLAPAASTPKAMPSAGTKPIAVLLHELQNAMDDDGYVITLPELANFYLALMASPLVILSGISGTGKSLLPRLFSKHTNPGSSFFPVPVQPQWSDNTDLFGYVPTLAPTVYVPGRIAEALLDALENSQKLVMVLLDEMNLAPVEHYFSDFLSVAETRQRIAGGDISSDKLPIELPDVVPPKYERLKDVCLPYNLRVVGTANMDETTKEFSPKVLDRAFAIEFDDPNLTSFASGAGIGARPLAELVMPLVDRSNPISVSEAKSASHDMFEQVAAMLNEVQEILAPAGIKFGYRTRDAILFYLHHWRSLELSSVLSSNAALDFCILQKVLPKCIGTGQALVDALEDLAKWLEKDRSGTEEANPMGFNGPFGRSLQKVQGMQKLLESDGATHYWGV